MRILIAEDDPVSRRLLEHHLEKWGYEVTSACDGEEAWRSFEVGGFPLVITDWMMPGLDGPGLLQRIRESRQPGYVFAILLTAKSQKEDLLKGMEAGADDFLTKPFDRDELRVRLRAGERIIRLEQELRAAQVAWVEAEKLAGLGRLAAGLAHEINNPIAFVSNNISVLKRDVTGVLEVVAKYGSLRDRLAQEEPELAEEVRVMEEKVDLDYFRGNVERLFASTIEGLKRISAIVQNLKDFARLDEAECKEVDLNAALVSTLEALRHEFESKGVRVETDLQPIPLLACQAGKINQVFLNILLNSAQASERDSVVEVRTRPDASGGVVVEVEDHGCGIREENLPRLFDPFFTTKPVGSGRGLGLSVSYGTVKNHGGVIEVETELGRGSVFRIVLPKRGRK